jgi:UDP-N-acetylglucosamine enolpyruvyl transferase
LARYVITGGNQLNGEVTISGAKNAAVAILPAAVLVAGKCRVENVPDISDVRILLQILEDMGVVVTREDCECVAVFDQCIELTVVVISRTRLFVECAVVHTVGVEGVKFFFIINAFDRIRLF